MNAKKNEMAQSLFKQGGPTPTMNDYQLEQLAHHKNRERLKAERLARESLANHPA